MKLCKKFQKIFDIKIDEQIKVTHIKQNPSNSLSILQNYIKNNEYKKRVRLCFKFDRNLSQQYRFAK